LDVNDINERLLQRIVSAISKAITEDVPQYLREYSKETNNATPHLRGDFINENIRKIVIDGDVELIPFKRYAWNGRIIVDKKEKKTYTITTKNNLRSIPKRKRDNPHFLHSILYIENGNFEAAIKQQHLFDIYPFEGVVLEDDYNSIFQGLINPQEGYRHYIVAYSTSNNMIKDIQIEFLDKNFDTIHELSLKEYVKMDFAQLTEIMPDENNNMQNGEGVRGLLKIKSRVNTKLRDMTKSS